MKEKKKRKSFFAIWKEVYELTKKEELEEQKKARLLEAKMDYQFLEELIQKCNENPLLRVRVTLKDGTVLDVNTAPKKKSMNYVGNFEEENFIEVR